MTIAASDAVDHGESPGGLSLPADQLYRSADLSALPFATTADLKPIESLFGQPRALEALRFGTRIEKPGFNLFVIGSPGARMSEAVQTLLRKAAHDGESRPDWVYVNNLDCTFNRVSLAARFMRNNPTKFVFAIPPP
jgi:hypothetical protein